MTETETITATDNNVDFPYYVGKALGITSQEWENVGLGDDPTVVASDDLDETVDRITSLLVIRIAAWIQPRGTYSDLSTTTICRKTLMDSHIWPISLTDEQVTSQLKQYVRTILSGYQDVPYHNFKHCYHVTVSTNKLIDMMLIQNETSDSDNSKEPLPYTFGFRDDPLMQFALLFSALIHDVQHQGIPNRQLATEDDELAIKYNDQSIAENQSLYIGFSELLKSKYDKLRFVIFPQKEDYRRFRSACVNLVLATDIASPERSQIAKSKWKEAFGDPYETVERKVLKQMERRSSTTKNQQSSGMNNIQPASAATTANKANRRMSTQSILSELSIESQKGGTSPGDLEDDSSVSLSPESSDTEDNDKNTQKAGNNGKGLQSNYEKLKAPAPMRLRKVDGLDSSRSAPGTLDSASQHSEMSGMALKFHRRLSTTAIAPNSKRYRNTRLGLRRTMDLSGESIEAYPFQETRTSATGAEVSHPHKKLEPTEKIDELRESVVMETILKAADVAHNLQGFEQMGKWSSRLFLELRKAYVEGRGESPQNGWFNNQIGFIDAYLLPLARKLDDTGVFGDEKGAVFATNVQENRDRWTREGMALTAKVVMEGEKAFPADDESTD